MREYVAPLVEVFELEIEDIILSSRDQYELDRVPVE